MPGGISYLHIGFVLLIVGVFFSRTVRSQPVIFGGFIGALIGFIVSFFSGFNGKAGIGGGFVAGSMIFTSFYLDPRIVDRGAIGGATICAILGVLFSAPTEAVVVLATLGSVMFSGVKFEEEYEPPTESRSGLKATESVQSSEPSTADEPDHAVTTDTTAESTQTPTGYEKTDVELRNAIDPSQKGMLRFALFYPGKRGFKPLLLVILASIASFLLLPLIIIFGYISRVAAAVVNGYKQPPAFTGLRGLMKDGIGITIIFSIYTTVAVLISAFLFSEIRGILAGIPLLVLGTILPAVFLSYIQRFRTLDMLNFVRIVRLMSSTTYLKHLIGQFLLLPVTAIPGTVVAIVIMIELNSSLAVSVGVSASLVIIPIFLVSSSLWGRAGYILNY